MNLFRSFQPAASAPVARERLQILLEYDRKLGSQIDLFTVLREEILAVVSRHIVDPENVQVTVDRGCQFLHAWRQYHDTQSRRQGGDVADRLSCSPPRSLRASKSSPRRIKRSACK
jgi:cell division topological specificity factor